MRLVNKSRLKRLAGIFWLTVYLSSAAAADADSGPERVVDAFHNILIEAMQAGDYETRHQILEPAIDKFFHDFTIARISLGLNWKSLSEEEQQHYQKLMNELIVSTYASRFDNYDGQTFAILNSKPLSKSRTRVKSKLTTKEEVVSLDYQLLQDEDTWRIYDIVANGVSDLSLKRSNYAAMFKSGGLAAVEAEISSNIEDNRSGN